MAVYKKFLGVPKAIFFIFFLLYVIQRLPAQQSTRLTDNWEFLRQDLGGIWEAVRPVTKGDPSSMPVWAPVHLPHCVNALDAVDPAGNYYRGPSWYRTQLELRNPYAKGRTLLHFEGAGQRTEVYVYTNKVGIHTGGYDEWTVDITDAAAAFAQTSVCQQQFKGRIPVSIRTDNSRDLEMIPSGLSDFTIYGGLYRYLDLVYTPALSVDQLFAQAETDPAGKEGRVHIKTLLYNPSGEQQATISVLLTDPDGHATGASIEKQLALPARRAAPMVNGAEADGNSRIADDTLALADLTIKSPRTWSPAHPALYTVTVTLSSASGVCTRTEKIGFRNAEFTDHGPFRLNGQRLLLQGTHRHEDYAGLGAAGTEEDMRREMILMKEMGVNFIRLAHYQQSHIILELCDSLGILVWEEIPWCRGGLGGEQYKNQARQMLTHMIGQHYNHPAVIIWGLGNENDWPGDFPDFDKEKIRTFMKALNDLAHRLDPSRSTAIRRCDFCSDIPDVYSPSIWAGWYRGIYTDYRSSTEEEFKKVKHFFHAEWGGDSHAGRHSENPDKALLAVRGGQGTDERAGDASLYGGAARVSKDGDWSESYICNLIDWHLKEQATMPWLTGSAQWVFKDFSTPVRPDNPIPFVNQKGVLERDLTRKEAYYVFQSYWTEKPMVHIYGHSWPVRWGEEGEGKMVKVYSNCGEATLFVNGKNYGTKKRSSQDFPAAGLRWTVPYTSGLNTLKVIARKGKTIVEDSISQLYQAEKWGKPARVKLESVAEPATDGRETATSGREVVVDGRGPDNGIVTVRVQLLDEKNIPCLDAADWVSFGLAGEGSLIDDQGTATGSRHVQACNGRALIRVRTRPGASVISVKAGSLSTVFLNL